MAEDDLQGNLQNYKLQLQQVEAALTTDPDNEELLKLKTDLEEVINLTCELIKTQVLEEQKLLKESPGDLEEALTESFAAKTKHEWKAGDRCLALWSQDGQHIFSCLTFWTGLSIHKTLILTFTAQTEIRPLEESDTFVNYHCVDYVSCKAIHDGLRTTDVVNWSQPFIFESIHERFMPGLMKIIQEKGLKINKDDKCLQVWMPPTRTRNILVGLQDELYFQPLDANDTSTVFKHWAYAGPRSEVIIRETLDNNGGVGILFRENNSFAGWAVEQHYGGIGMLFVFPEFRRRGYAFELVKGMVMRSVDREIDPFAIIEESNNQSRLLFEKLGFKKISGVHWIKVEQKVS